MGCALKIFHFSLVVAIMMLPLQQQPESVSSVSSIFVIGQAKLRAAPPEQKLTFEIAYLVARADQTPQINPSVLKVDLKQNLLVWPNIANDLTRSPPRVSVQSLS
jgi:hypothetical protein